MWIAFVAATLLLLFQNSCVILLENTFYLRRVREISFWNLHLIQCSWRSIYNLLQKKHNFSEVAFLSVRDEGSISNCHSDLWQTNDFHICKFHIGALGPFTIKVVPSKGLGYRRNYTTFYPILLSKACHYLQYLEFYFMDLTFVTGVWWWLPVM